MNTLDKSATGAVAETESGGYRILVVEDEPEHQLLVRKALAREGSGFTMIQFARDSEEAVRFAQQMAFDVMLVDNRIPGTRGLDLLTELREVGVDAPFVLMTSAGSEDLVVEAMRQKVAEYIIKDSGFWRDLPQVLRRVVLADQQRRREQDLLGRLERTNARLDSLRADMAERALKLAGLVAEARGLLGTLQPRLSGAAESARLTAIVEEMGVLVE